MPLPCHVACQVKKEGGKGKGKKGVKFEAPDSPGEGDGDGGGSTKRGGSKTAAASGGYAVPGFIWGTMFSICHTQLRKCELQLAPMAANPCL